ncbi:hypothetical protein EV361DRAFT_284217 [Lentinula raphanica]|uniref:Uncharacterized protein n=1 Tax=Lentinula raphanica TaxID=153919 RepID=A0AA38P0C1_9AGAR|nr:hypothetical protein FB446DRAFT_271620 [Lentinula raphanica]KAJ3818999.1 hypothetical protein F5880DRAFT_1159689 [Lentinula raphanica]KAJ3833947.1 hypothetical protein F5878DRAFT_631706 [Lentinula raphanica]KAJ3970407.1 hypothetical protein EV361DRAFT_284217 [Lentinula raphanica]
MNETRRLLEAASALSRLLVASHVSHAFYGSVFTAILANIPQCEEIYCIVEGGQHPGHAFRRVRDAVADSDDFSTTLSPWTNRLHVTYRRPIPAVEIEILPAGEAGPRRLDASTVVKIQGIPFLAISEFVRAKLKSWMIRMSDRDAQDIIYVLSRYWNRVDINRIPEQDMNYFATRHTSSQPWWLALKRKYGMS